MCVVMSIVSFHWSPEVKCSGKRVALFQFISGFLFFPVKFKIVYLKTKKYSRNMRFTKWDGQLGILALFCLWKKYKLTNQTYIHWHVTLMKEFHTTMALIDWTIFLSLSYLVGSICIQVTPRTIFSQEICTCNFSPDISKLLLCFS